jgi:hypothetical protein
VRVVRSADGSEPPAIVGESFSTCPRNTYVGITCDACPVSQSCETGEDDIRSARLFNTKDRLFAIYVATDVRRRMGYSLDKTPSLGVGCVCALTEREKHEYADSLVVVEIIPPSDPKQVPLVVERMRIALAKPHTLGLLSLTPRLDGDVDVLVGDALTGFQGQLTTFQPSHYRLLRVSTKSIPR